LDEKLLFLIGSNGAGKSSTLQALTFISFFAAGKTSDFFIERGWTPAAVKARTPHRAHNTLRYQLIFQGDDGQRILWRFVWGLASQTNILEDMWVSEPGAEAVRLYSYGNRTSLRTGGGEEIKGLVSAGALFRVIEPESLATRPDIIRKLMSWCAGITSLELLSPIAMRNSDRGSPKGIGARGQRLAGFISALDTKAKAQIIDRLKDFYPLEGLNTTRKKAGWIDLRVAEGFGIGEIPTQHVSDGFLRLLALCAIPNFGTTCTLVLLDEIEDGIEPHVLPRIIERVVKDSSAQFVMTSHSPLLINFFSADQISLILRTPEGRAKFTPISDLDIIKSGLEYQGPGEIWANSGLATLEHQAMADYKPPTPDEQDQAKYTDINALRMLSAL
jgi:predicted ATPase